MRRFALSSVNQLDPAVASDAHYWRWSLGIMISLLALTLQCLEVLL